MTHVVVLGIDAESATAYRRCHADSQMQFTIIGDENAEENFMRDEDKEILKKAGIPFEYLLNEQKPQDCHALVYADVVLLGISEKQLELYSGYLTAVFMMRAKANALQPFQIVYKKENSEQAQQLLRAVCGSVKEETAMWFHQMANVKELQLM